MSNYTSSIREQAVRAIAQWERFLSSLHALIQMDRIDRVTYQQNYALAQYGLATENRLLHDHAQADKHIELARQATASILEGVLDE